MDDVDKALTAAADLLEKPGAWIQGSYARNASGHGTGVNDDDACSFCVAGAMQRVNLHDYVDAWNRMSDRNGDLIIWNDAPGRTQAEVVAALRAARKVAT